MADEVQIRITAEDRTERAFRSARQSLIPLAAAILPVTAAAVPMAAAMLAAGTAAAAFGAAVVPQILDLAELAQAQTKYRDAVKASGAASAEAVKAEQAMQIALEDMPPATQEAAAGFTVLKDDFDAWSDSLATDTMDVFTHSFATLNGIFPAFTPAVQGASREMDRFVTIVAGGVNSDSFDSFAANMGDFGTNTLDMVNDGMIDLIQVMSDFDSSSFDGFLDYVQTSGPLAADTIGNLAEALFNVLEAGGPVGLSMLEVANAFSAIVVALPPEFIATVLQLYAAFKLLGTAGAIIAALSAHVTLFSTRLSIMAAASSAAGGGLAGLRAAFLSLSATMRSTGITAAIAGVAVVVSQLSASSGEAGPDVDKLTASLDALGRTNEVGGEAARLYGEDLEGLTLALDQVANSNDALTFLEDLTTGFGLFAEGSVRLAEKDVAAFDQALANMVSSGNADGAAAALDRVGQQAEEQGFDFDKLRGTLGEYDGALADVALEQQLTAQAMGLFGEQAAKTQAQLEEQKASADALRQAIQDLNDVNRAALSAQNAFEQAIDDAAKAAADNADALSVVNGELDLNSQSARDAESALNDLAARTDELAAAKREEGGTWEQVNGIYARGQEELIRNAELMGLNERQARELADQILQTPDKTARLRGNLDDLKAKLAESEERLRKARGEKRVRIKGDIAQLKADIAETERRLNNIPDEVVNVYTHYVDTGSPYPPVAREFAHGGVVGAQAGGPRSAMTLVGEQGPELVRLPFGSTVIPNGQSENMMAGWASGGGDRPIHITLQIGSHRLGDILIDPLRNAVRARGGIVQAVLGKGSI